MTDMQQAVNNFFEIEKHRAQTDPKNAFTPTQISMQAVRLGATNEQVKIARATIGDWTITV